MPGGRSSAVGATVLLLSAGSCDAPSGHPAAPSGAPPRAARQWFTEHTARSGLDFAYQSGATGRLYLPEIMGAGAALFDYDNDGDLDLYLTNGYADPAGGGPAGGMKDRLYRNESDGAFIDVTDESGLGDPGYGMGVAVGDFDNDGNADLYVTNFGPDRLYRNRGDGTFEDVTERAGIDVPGWSASAAFFDYDRDGDLDLYVTQYVLFDRQRRCFDHAGRPDYCGPKAFSPVPDVLLRNDGGTFTDVSAAAGIDTVACAGLGVVCEDFDEDGWPDVYVANDAYPNQLWLNRRDGTFADVATELGAAYNMHGQAEAGMGVIAEDLDNDGACDLFITHLAAETNTFYRSMGPGAAFADLSGPSGLGPPSMAFTGFGTCAFDADLDGDLDVAVVNGRVNRMDPLPASVVGPPWDRLAEPKQLYVNEGKARFRLLGDEARAFCAPAEVSRALAMGDLDNDGDVDLVVTNIESKARIFYNDAPRAGRWLTISAIDPRLKREAIGARVTVLSGAAMQSRTVRRAFSYLSSSDPRVHFGLGEVDQVTAVYVRWPDGLREGFSVGCVDCAVELRRGEGEAVE